jgi:RHS repeat-associated protein
VNASTGALVQRLDYDEFGRVTFDSNPGAQPFGFAGGIYDADTGLVRFGARDYHAETGRWTIPDPLMFEDAPNIYIYATWAPNDRVDLDGRGDKPWRNPNAPVQLPQKAKDAFEAGARVDPKQPNGQNLKSFLCDAGLTGCMGAVPNTDNPDDAQKFCFACQKACVGEKQPSARDILKNPNL